MGQDLAPWRPRQTTSLLGQKSLSARAALSSTTSPAEAARAAKQLVGSYAHMKPGDPEVFVTSVAAVLADYPLALVHECADPRTGIARAAKFLSVAELVEWLDRRLEQLQAFASHVPRPPALPAPVYSEEHKTTMRQRFTDLIAGMMARSRDPIDELRKAWRANSQAGA